MAKGCSEVLLELARADERIFGVSCECQGNVARMAQEFPDRVVEVGIAEPNLIGVAAGLAVRGKIPFVHGMAPFVTMRCFEQIRDDVAYGKRNVKIIAAYSGGISMSDQGITHHATEDIALMRLIPGMTVIMPADGSETEKAMRAVATRPGAAYICVAWGSYPGTDEARPFEVGKAIRLREGRDVCLISTGPMVREAWKAADLLDREGVSTRLLDMHTVKPLDQDAVLDAARETPLLITLEEHTTLGGLGGAVSEVVAEAGIGTPVARFGLRDTFAWAIGSYEDLKRHYAMNAEAIVEFVLRRTRQGQA
jgi:transketolase